MSSYIIKIIPLHENTVPSDKDRSAITNQLRTITSNKKISEHLHEEVSFIDSGSNFDGIRCNQCLRELEMDWWAEQMNICSTNHFKELSIITPCCSSAVSLNELQYICPMGFARYVIEMINPEKDEVIEIEQLIAKNNYRLIRAHY
ncbi:hypothetical protein GC101_25395 [Paenibacillus sp. LMG 31459]|uniref:Uncharacterized protein n=1 Tax=Paenibacillus phytohabitans TaxID=2654978 RepID=A0ABX1YR39_9BACL|nr:hypothetical protein [Paenibacillus phytohabitans]NOU82205.1 hypothetical protein [Paenibacillus phytohabitans]